ncbi:MAG: hypothetical protein Terrestrivirus10_12 [Terrestrivirus sp.]|uniref:Uncharacterized protein n=1 Tax=Terrestrivirus sp. TaxID=2487775 RepID=A0A3G4ZP16_9VIRU|nr:MAG: hypothetical protein Terrestrivirus10_12 [Terrestrivirus sp.]
MVLFDIKKHVQLVLKKVIISPELLENFGTVNVEQIYTNNTTELLEVKYVFPLTENDTITSLSFTVDDQEIVGILKEQGTARQEYTEAVGNKQTAMILTKRGSQYEINLGNVEPGAHVVVRYTYITNMELKNGRYKFVVPMNIAPKYEQTINDIYYRSKVAHTSDKELFYDIFMNLTWKSKGIIKSMESLTHEPEFTFNSVNTKGDETTESCRELVSVSAKLNPFNGDFNLFMETDEKNYPVCYRYDQDGKSYLMTQFRVESKEDEVVKNLVSEYVFMIDRSGSMDSDGKMEKANEALCSFLNKLPTHCYFNVISFGDKHESLFSSPKQCTKKNIDDAIKTIKSFKANLGGTEIHRMVEKLVSESTLNRRVYFLVTDGQVSGVDVTGKLIKEKKKMGDRFFTVGIGRDASRELTEKLAIAGNGDSLMVIDTNELETSVLDMLDNSSKKYMTNINCYANFNKNDKNDKIEGDLVDKICSNNKCIVPGKIVTTYMCADATVMDNIESLKLTANIPGNQTLYETHVKLPEATLQDKVIRQLYGINKIHRFNCNVMNERKLMVECSLEYDILCDQTAFIGVKLAKISEENADKNIISHEVKHFDSSNIERSRRLNTIDGLMNRGMVLEAQCETLCMIDECYEIQKAVQLKKSSVRMRRSVSSPAFALTRAASSVSKSVASGYESMRSKLTKASSDIKNIFFKESTNSDKFDVDILVKLQNVDGSFKDTDELYTMFEFTRESVKKASVKDNLDEYITLQLYMYLMLRLRLSLLPTQPLKEIVKRLEMYLKIVDDTTINNFIASNKSVHNEESVEQSN